MTTLVESDLIAIISNLKPSNILCIGSSSKEALSEYQEAFASCNFESVEVKTVCDQFNGMGKYDLALLSNVLENLDKTTAGILISKLRDLYCQHLIIVVPIGPNWPGNTSVWNKNDLLGYGLIQVSEYEQDGKPMHIYAFDIATYKTTPDWLSGKFWANPEIENKYQIK